VRLEAAHAAASFRRDSEDRAAIHPVPGGLVVVVSDGAGGLPGGAAAAERVLALVAEGLRRGDVDPADAGAWVARLALADADVEADGACGEATAVVVAVFEDGRVIGASAGDSGALLVDERGVHDELTAGQHRKRRLGSGRAAPVPFTRSGVAGTLVVASDGLFAYARADAIARVVAGPGPLDHVAAALVEIVRPPRSRDLVDDVAIVVVRAAT
jgi:serine/threonine protein phosphatase PrpC